MPLVANVRHVPSRYQPLCTSSSLVAPPRLSRVLKIPQMALYPRRDWAPLLKGGLNVSLLGFLLQAYALRRTSGVGSFSKRQ
jgi:hypothetical protein